jgi:outer membrane protein
MKKHSSSLLCAAALVVPMLAAAQSGEHPYWIHLGPTNVQFESGGDVTVGGAIVPNASSRATDNTTLGFELGYDLSPKVSVRLTLGIPPTTSVEGTGNLSASAGVPQPLAKVTYGPAVLSATWHPLGRSGFSPYIGAGLNYPIVFKVEDQFLVNVHVQSKIGTAIQLGTDYTIDDKWGLFLDVKKLFAEVDVSANLPGGGPAATTTAKLNPLVVQAGVSYRF